MNFCPDCGKPKPSDIHTCNETIRSKLDPITHLEDQLDHLRDIVSMLRRRIDYIERQLEEHFNV